MSVEMITIIIAAASLFVTVSGGLFASAAWLLRRINERFDKVDDGFEKIDDRFDKVDEQFMHVDSQIRGLQAELNEVRVAVVRLEGPVQRLICPH